MRVAGTRRGEAADSKRDFQRRSGFGHRHRRAEQTAAASPAAACSGHVLRLGHKDAFGHPAFNPLSYHLGSVWPVENATTVFGLRRFGFDREAIELASGLYDLARLWKGYRVHCPADEGSRRRLARVAHSRGRPLGFLSQQVGVGGVEQRLERHSAAELSETRSEGE